MFDKNGFGYILVDSFINSSGHPDYKLKVLHAVYHDMQNYLPKECSKMFAFFPEQNAPLF
jgi:hypothetical protein